MRMMRLTGRAAVGEVDSVYAWLRLLAGVLTSTIGGVGNTTAIDHIPTPPMVLVKTPARRRSQA